MTRQLKRAKERQEAKAKTRVLGPKADPDTSAIRYIQKLRTLSLGRLGKEFRDVYRDAEQMDRVLMAFRMENGGALPLLSSPEAPLALAIGNKFYYIASEIHRRGIVPDRDCQLGGDHFTEFFRQVAENTKDGVKETLKDSFLSRFATKVRTLLHRKP